MPLLSDRLSLPSQGVVSHAYPVTPGLIPVPLARQSPVAFFKALFTQNSSCPSLPLQLFACFWMEFPWGKKKRQNSHFFNHFFLNFWIGKCTEVSLWVVLLFNPH